MIIQKSYINQKSYILNMNLEEIKSDLESNGYCVIPNILTEEQIAEYTSEFHKWRKSIPTLDKHHEIVHPHNIYKFYQVGQQRFAWLVRINPKVQEVFKYLWDTDELVVSFDSCCYMNEKVKKKDKVWTHTDQSSKKKGVHCYQGFVSFTDNVDRSLVVYEGTNNLHESYYNEMNIVSKGDWNLIVSKYLDKIADKRKVLEVPKGSLVIWESRTFHQNQYGTNGEERLVQYISYLPKNGKKNSEAMIKKRKNYFETLRTTSHWAYPIRVNSLQPQTYGNDEYLIDYSKLEKPKLYDLIDEINKIL